MFSAVKAAPVVIVGQDTIQNGLGARYQTHVLPDQRQCHDFQKANLQWCKATNKGLDKWLMAASRTG